MRVHCQHERTQLWEHSRRVDAVGRPLCRPYRNNRGVRIRSLGFAVFMQALHSALFFLVCPVTPSVLRVWANPFLCEFARLFPCKKWNSQQDGQVQYAKCCCAAGQKMTTGGLWLSSFSRRTVCVKFNIFTCNNLSRV